MLMVEGVSMSMEQIWCVYHTTVFTVHNWATLNYYWGMVVVVIIGYWACPVNTRQGGKNNAQQPWEGKEVELAQLNTKHRLSVRERGSLGTEAKAWEQASLCFNLDFFPENWYNNIMCVPVLVLFCGHWVYCGVLSMVLW